jgi:hypothetical protein
MNNCDSTLYCVIANLLNSIFTAILHFFGLVTITEDIGTDSCMFNARGTGTVPLCSQVCFILLVTFLSGAFSLISSDMMQLDSASIFSTSGRYFSNSVQKVRNLN